MRHIDERLRNIKHIHEPKLLDDMKRILDSADDTYTKSKMLINKAYALMCLEEEKKTLQQSKRYITKALKEIRSE